MSFLSALKSSIQLFSLIFSLFLNSILIYLIATKSPKKMGTYKHLMCYFSTFSMIYALDDWIVKPYIHSYGASFSMIMDLRDSWIPEDAAFFLVASLAGCFGVTIYAIAINFIFRFFAFERRGRLRYFKGKFLPVWFLIPIFGGLSWVLLCWLLMYPDLQFSEYLRESIKENYSLEADNITYTGAFFYRTDSGGNVFWSFKNSLGALGLNVLMSIPFITILIFGSRSYKIVRKLIFQGESDYAKRLQMQLYKALVAQVVF
ncbi:unnamed protein product [Caenorhabditis sp. 36 PRJEB53466]|nr:unnamed protein product [Caenorhabditis sp. 36 PRJEB53466]